MQKARNGNEPEADAPTNVYYAIVFESLRDDKHRKHECENDKCGILKE
jgi:hypothetical protein